MTFPAPSDILCLYFGNLPPGERPQFYTNGFFGLALTPRYERDIEHDARNPLPLPDNSVPNFQSQDVFEHIAYERVPFILGEIYRCLKPGGLFRLSLPDYHSPPLYERSVYDVDGNILCDLAMGGRVGAKFTGGVVASFAEGGGSHLWFPIYATVSRLILASSLRHCAEIEHHHGFYDRHHFVCTSYEEGIMPVRRAPPHDMRADGKPVSMIWDFIK